MGVSTGSLPVPDIEVLDTLTGVGLPANTLLLFSTYAKLNQLKLNGEHGERSELNVVNEVPLR
jgi:hypothetical protein